MKRIHIFLIFISVAFTTNAQYVIKGKIVDDSNMIIPFANIMLYEEGENAPVFAIPINEDGTYFFENVVIGSYQVEVSSLGFKTKKSSVFEVLETKKEYVFNFTLEMDQLDEVVITSKKPRIKQTAEKLVLDVGNSEMINSNLEDVVKKIPGVLVSNGTLSYAGQSNIRILINGKSTDYIDVATLLRELPVDNIARVELIQQPGAEFDAAGSGPLINIILKKNVKLGTHGTIKSAVGYDNDWLYVNSASIASYKNKINWQASAGYSQNAWREDLQIIRKVEDQAYDQTSISPYDPAILRLSAGLDYYISKKQSIGFSFRRNQSDSDRVTSNTTIISNPSNSQELLTDNSFDKNWRFYVINPYYEYEDDKNKLVLDFNYVGHTSKDENNLFQTVESSIDYNDQRYFQNSDYSIRTYKGDYKRELSKNITWSLGTKFSSINSDSDLKSLEKNDLGVFENNAGQTNQFVIDETILALYSKLAINYNKWNLSAGLRWEESKTQGTSITLDETTERNISKLFPSASISRDITSSIGASVAYSYRINRPVYSSLNSFVYYYDPFTFEAGNPQLKPSFTNSFQFNLTYDEQPFFTVSYRKTTDALFQILSQNDVTGDASRTMINIASNENWGFRAFAPLNFAEGLDGFTGIIANHNRYSSKELLPELALSKWGFTWYTSAEYKLPWGINSELSGHYTSGGLQGQIEYEWLAGLDIALSRTFFNDRLKVNFELDTILGRKFFGEINYNNINAEIVSDWSRRNVYLQFIYSFGSKFGKKKKRAEASGQEMDRIDTKN